MKPDNRNYGNKQEVTRSFQSKKNKTQLQRRLLKAQHDYPQVLQNMMKLKYLLSGLCGFFLVSAAHAAKTNPNILFIVADDLGWKDVGFHGSDIKTPNIDSLAAGGTKLEQYYVQPMCTPTRAALMTGRYPFRYGLQTAVIPAGSSYGLATDEWLLPQA